MPTPASENVLLWEWTYLLTYSLLYYDNGHNLAIQADDKTINDMWHCTNSLMFLIHNARSFVINPASIVSTHTSSSACANRASWALPSSLARWARPRVHANTDAVYTQTTATIRRTSQPMWTNVIILCYRERPIRIADINIGKFEDLGYQCSCLADPIQWSK